jgi:hypothetical protein
MPAKVSKTKGGYKVTHGDKTSAKRTTKKKAESQARLLNAIDHGYDPDAEKPKRKRGRKKANT